MSDCRPLVEHEVEWKVELRPRFSTPAQEDTDPKRWKLDWAIKLSALWAGFRESAYWPECPAELTVESFLETELCGRIKTSALESLNRTIDLTADILDSLK